MHISNSASIKYGTEVLETINIISDRKQKYFEAVKCFWSQKACLLDLGLTHEQTTVLFYIILTMHMFTFQVVLMAKIFKYNSFENLKLDDQLWLVWLVGPPVIKLLVSTWCKVIKI